MGNGSLQPQLTAQADSINANTFMTLNEYMWNVVKNENRENWEHRKQVQCEPFWKHAGRSRSEYTTIQNGLTSIAVTA